MYYTEYSYLLVNLDELFFLSIVQVIFPIDSTIQ
jgi:hypothetical protein